MKDKEVVSSKPQAPPSAKLSSRDWKTLVITTQQFDGCWDEAALVKILDAAVVKKLMEENPCSDVTVWTSAIALAILELKCMAVKTSWEVVANKGRAFMSKKLFALEKKDKDETVQRVMQLIAKAKESLGIFL